MTSFTAYAEETRSLSTQFAVAIESNDVDKIKSMLEANVPPDTLIEYGEHKITPLMKAAHEGAAEIIELLLEAGANVNAQATDSKETALMNAATRGHVTVVRSLLEHKADVKPSNTYGSNALNNAVGVGHIEVAEMLLEHGADVEKGWEMKAEGVTHSLSPLMSAVASGNVEMIRFLAKKGADLNSGAKSGPQTPLILAIYQGKIESVNALIELKANVNAKTKDGDTALKAAQKGDQEDVIAILKAAGAKP